MANLCEQFCSRHPVQRHCPHSKMCQDQAKACELPAKLTHGLIYSTTQVGRWCEIDLWSGHWLPLVGIYNCKPVNLSTQRTHEGLHCFSHSRHCLIDMNVNGILPSKTTTTRKWLEASIYSWMFDIMLPGLRALLLKAAKTSSAEINCIALLPVPA